MTEHYDFVHWNGRNIRLETRENTVDFNSYQSTIHNDEYGFKELGLKRGDVIIDVGAYNGGEGIALAMMDLDLKTYSYEPITDNCDIYRRNMENNGLRGITIMRRGVGGKRGTLPVFSNPITGDGAYRYVGVTFDDMKEAVHFLGMKEGSTPPLVEEVPIVTLQDIFDENRIQHCAILKLDCEGPEVEILRNSTKEILAKIDWIIGETHSITRKDLHAIVADQFTDEKCEYQNDVTTGHFRFKRRKA